MAAMVQWNGLQRQALYPALRKLADMMFVGYMPQQVGRPTSTAISRGRPHKRGVLMSWLILFFAGLLETVWAVGLKYTEGFSRFWPSLMTLAAMAASLWLLSIAM